MRGHQLGVGAELHGVLADIAVDLVAGRELGDVRSDRSTTPETSQPGMRGKCVSMKRVEVARPGLPGGTRATTRVLPAYAIDVLT
ncbi:hypothetical protein GCM10010321_07980 [Streptomyces chartreusis]|nr:hypothetical protein GCM10010321_07980 [Streptomyces chartreusis]